MVPWLIGYSLLQQEFLNKPVIFVCHFTQLVRVVNYIPHQLLMVSSPSIFVSRVLKCMELQTEAHIFKHSYFGHKDVEWKLHTEPLKRSITEPYVEVP